MSAEFLLCVRARARHLMLSSFDPFSVKCETHISGEAVRKVFRKTMML